MKLLLDECVDRRLAGVLSQHQVRTVPWMGWAGIKNGALLALAAPEFDAFITVDRKLPTEHNLDQLSIGVVLLRAKTNRLQDLLPLVPQLLEVLGRASTARLTVIGQ